MRSIVITFGIICFCSLVLLQMAKIAWIKNTFPAEVVVGLFAAVFFIAGILISRRPKTGIVPSVIANEQPAAISEPVQYERPKPDSIPALGISKREYEVLCEIALGHSNTEIANKLFISESTVKTHVSNLLVKLDAKRRTEAVRKAKELKII